MGTFSDRGGSCTCVAGLVVVGIGLLGVGLAIGMFFPWTECEAGCKQVQDQDTNPSAPIPLGTPKLLISSTGMTTELKGNYLGLYELQAETNNNHSVYILKHTIGVDHPAQHLYTNGIFWKVRNDFSSTGVGNLQSLADPDNPMPPRTGWTFYDDGEQLSDPDLKVEPIEEDPWCSTITVTATGKAGVKIHTVLGHYKRTELWSSGKPVYKLTDGSHFLLHLPNKLGWSIRSSLESGLKIFTDKGTICPADPRAKKSESLNQDNWKYDNGTDWVEGEFSFIDNCHPKEH